MVFPAPYGIFDREQTIEAVAGSSGWRRYDLSEATAAELGDSAALLVYRADAVRADGSEYSAYISSVYVRRDGEWKLALHHQTPI